MLTLSRTLFLCVVGVIAATVLVPMSAVAQRGGFRVGDRVMASPSSLRDEKYWRPCTVTEVHDFVPKKAYSLKCDPQTPGGSTASFLVNADWVRPMAAGEDNAAADERPVRNNVGGMGTMGAINRAGGGTANRGGAAAVQCFASSAGNGGGAMDKAFRESIVHGFSHEPRPGEDGRITVEVESLTVGGSHPYRVLQDPPDAVGKTIYAARATFTTCTDYNRRVVYTKRTRQFACFKSTGGQWDCEVVAAVNTNVNDETKSVDKPR